MFYSLWRLKEAMIKAIGLSLFQNPSEFQIPSSMRCGARRDIVQFPKIPNVKWKLENPGNLQFAAAVVHEMIPTSET